jgi:N-acetylmuramoyl-L-alanine amidase
MSGFAPDYAGADVRVSPNFGPRLGSGRPDMIILHYTGMPTGPAAEEWLCNPESQVSSHYLIHEDGRVVQMVREGDRAWHAGKSSWRGLTDINSCSIGIEIVNPGHEFGYDAFPMAQMDSVIALCRDITKRHLVLPERLLAHSDVAPGRKIDPGEKFDWELLAEAGLGHFVAPVPVTDGPSLALGDSGDAVQCLQSMLSLYGYGVEITGQYDQRTSVVTAAFQRHFRPALVDGVTDPSTVETLQRLVESLPDCFE